MSSSLSSERLWELKDLSVGQRFTSGRASLSAEEIKNFAAQFDPQPFHMDEAAAEKSIFGGLVASGWHTASLSMRLIVQSVKLKGGLIGLGGTLSWLKPVIAGTSIRVESEIVEINPSRSKPGQAVVVLHCIVKNDADEMIIEFTPKLMVFGDVQ